MFWKELGVNHYAGVAALRLRRRGLLFGSGELAVKAGASHLRPDRKGISIGRSDLRSQCSGNEGTAKKQP